MSRLVFRAWYYFRTGYGIYIAFIVGFLSNVVVIYKLAIEDVIKSGSTRPGSLGNYLQIVFPTLGSFIIIAALVAIPVCVYIGILHMKRTGAYEADASVSLEEHPYSYKAVPGKEQEVFLPLMMLTAQSLAELLEQQNRLTPEQRKQFDEAIQKARMLIQGEKVGARR